MQSAVYSTVKAYFFGTRRPCYFLISRCQENIKHFKSLTRTLWLLNAFQGIIVMLGAELEYSNKMKILFFPTLPKSDTSIRTPKPACDYL